MLEALYIYCIYIEFWSICSCPILCSRSWSWAQADLETWSVQPEGQVPALNCILSYIYTIKPSTESISTGNSYLLRFFTRAPDQYEQSRVYLRWPEECHSVSRSDPVLTSDYHGTGGGARAKHHERLVERRPNKHKGSGCCSTATTCGFLMWKRLLPALYKVMLSHTPVVPAVLLQHGIGSPLLLAFGAFPSFPPPAVLSILRGWNSPTRVPTATSKRPRFLPGLNIPMRLVFHILLDEFLVSFGRRCEDLHRKCHSTKY